MKRLHKRICPYCGSRGDKLFCGYLDRWYKSPCTGWLAADAIADWVERKRAKRSSAVRTVQGDLIQACIDSQLSSSFEHQMKVLGVGQHRSGGRKHGPDSFGSHGGRWYGPRPSWKPPAP